MASTNKLLQCYRTYSGREIRQLISFQFHLLKCNTFATFAVWIALASLSRHTAETTMTTLVHHEVEVIVEDLL